MSRADAPVDQQWTRALIAVALGLAFTYCLMIVGSDDPSVRTVLPELRALAGVSCFVI